LVEKRGSLVKSGNGACPHFLDRKNDNKKKLLGGEKVFGGKTWFAGKVNSQFF